MSNSVIRFLRNTSFAALLISLMCAAAFAQENPASGNAVEPNRELLADLERQVSLPLPETSDLHEQCVFYHKRGMANSRLGRYDRAISDLKQALVLNQPSRLAPNNWGDRWRIQTALAASLSASGDYAAQIEHLKSVGAEWMQRYPRYDFDTQLDLVGPYVSLGMLREAEESFHRATELLPGFRNLREWEQKGHKYNVMDRYSSVSAWLMELRGNYVEAERLRRAALDNSRQYLPVRLRIDNRDSEEIRVAQRNLTSRTYQLASLLSAQGKLGEAEYLAHEALSQTLAYSSFNTVAVSSAISALRSIKLQQGQFTEASRYAELALQAIERADVQPYSWTLADRRGQVGQIHVIEGRWNDALKVYELRDQGLRSNPEQFGKRGSRDTNWALALLRTGQNQRAIEMLQGTLDANIRKPFVDPIVVAQKRGYLGVALSEQGNSPAALIQFKESLPVLLKQAQEAAGDNDAGFVSTYRLRIIIEGYLELLARLHASGQPVTGLDVVGEAFKLADIARNSSVQRAVTSSAARATMIPGPTATA